MSPAEAGAVLAAALGRVGEPGEVRALQRLTGGATKQTWSFDWVHGDRNATLILQQAHVQNAPPSASLFASPPPSASPRLRAPKLSAEQTAALMVVARDGGVPTSVARRVPAPADGLGPACVTERVANETLGRRLVEHVEHVGLAAVRPLMARPCCEILARIHRLPTAALPFLATLSPADEVAAYGPGGLLARFTLRQQALAYAQRWVHEQLPARWEPCVVHSHLRTGNLVVGADSVRCVLDWEIAHIVDPMDMGVPCMPTWRFGGASEVGGFGSCKELYTAYKRAAGVPIDPETRAVLGGVLEPQVSDLLRAPRPDQAYRWRAGQRLTVCRWPSTGRTAARLLLTYRGRTGINMSDRSQALIWRPAARRVVQ